MSVGLGPLGGVGGVVAVLVHANLWKGCAVDLNLFGGHSHLDQSHHVGECGLIAEDQASGEDSGLDGPVQVVQGGQLLHLVGEVECSLLRD